jgi:catechol 2,3-dioxygenase-like lactoylglutathione lyase family enzyme
MTQNLFERIDGVFMPVIDLQKSIEWYKDKLGLTLLYTWEGGAGFKVYEGDSLLGLIQVNEIVPAFFKSQEGKMHYFNFKTMNIENSYKILKDRGVQVSEIIDAGSIKVAYFHDPDDNMLGMCQELK